MSKGRVNLDEMAVFAGALESHNGVDKLVRQWIQYDINYPLHVFGRGSLEKEIRDMAERSEWVFFHGLVSEAEVAQWQARSLWNFCLRYSIGLNQRYFFPSKFFNIAAAPGGVIVNNLYGLPDVLRPYLSVVDEGLTQLKSALDKARVLGEAEFVKERHELLRDSYSWRACILTILSRLSVDK
ncbi:hypothetical protein GCM10007933_02160 [Zoogloea oryzae]|uniref:Glycosyltransferase family 1 protein n=2 Tax=Zoogloea oryzae TaxID=310767 RepID=A0ABQ6F713_9RHOO|nr:hypothetical protein GCM10007933_02160 [Zoogloea oryzae]